MIFKYTFSVLLKLFQISSLFIIIIKIIMKYYIISFIQQLH